MKTGFLFSVFAAGCLTLAGEDLLLENGETIKDAVICSKDQYGINIRDHYDPVRKSDVLRRIHFLDLSASSLRMYPMFDAKTNERIIYALKDRFEMLEKRYKDRREDMIKSGNFAQSASIPSGLNSLKVIFKAEKSLENGTVGWANSDTTDAILYGKIYLYGLKIIPGTEAILEIYCTEEVFPFENNRYALFTFLPPAADQSGKTEPADDEKPGKKHSAGNTAGGGKTHESKRTSNSGK